MANLPNREAEACVLCGSNCGKSSRALQSASADAQERGKCAEEEERERGRREERREGKEHGGGE